MDASEPGTLGACTCVMVMIKCSHRHCNNTTIEKIMESEKRNVIVLSRLVPAGSNQAQKGMRNRACIILVVTCELNDRGKRGFTIFKNKRR